MQIKSYMTAREAALLLYNSLTGEAEAELEHAPLERINSDTGIQYILECLKAPMEQKAVYQKRKYLADFEQLNRYPGEGLRTLRTDTAVLKDPWKHWGSASPVCMMQRPVGIGFSSGLA